MNILKQIYYWVEDIQESFKKCLSMVCIYVVSTIIGLVSVILIIPSFLLILLIKREQKCPPYE